MNLSLGKKLNTYLKERDYKPLWHALSVLVIISASFVLFYTHFISRGTLMHVDMSFPTSIDRNISLYNQMWWQYGSVMNIWNVQRVFWAYPLLVVAKILHLSNAAYLFVLFSGTLALAGISMYALVVYLFNTWDIGRKNRAGIYISAVVAAVIYMYNPFSLAHLWPYFGYPVYAVLPVVFILLKKAVDSGSTGRIVALAVVISICSTGPICVFCFWFMIITYLLFDLAGHRFRLKQVLSHLKILGITLAVYISIGMLWILPYVYSQMANKPFVPSYGEGVTQTMLDGLSAPNTIASNFRLISGWGMPVDMNPTNWFWTMLSFLLPVVALAGLILLARMKKVKPVAVYWALISALSIILAAGSLSIIGKLYSYVVLKAPGAASFGWVLRSPDRWLYFVPIFYALMCAVVVARLFEEKKKMRTALAAVVIILLVISMLPVTLLFARNVYDSTKIPPDYDEADNYIQQKAGNERVLWVPFYRDGFRFYWAPTKRIGAFYVYSSNPSVNNLQNPYGISYFYWLNELLSSGTSFVDSVIHDKDLILGDDTVSRLLAPFAAGTVILDNSIPDYKFGRTFRRDGGVKLSRKTKWLDIYQLPESTGAVKASSCTVLSNDFYDNLSISQALTPEQLNNVSFIDYGLAIGRKYGLIKMEDYLHLSNWNGGFEEINEYGLVAHWLPEDFGKLRLMSSDTGVKAGGKASLKVINRSATELDMNWVQGAPVAVAPGSIYVIESSVKYRNSEWTCVVVEGRNRDTGEWSQLIYSPTVGSGTSGWKDYRCSFRVPGSIDTLRVRLASGWVRDTSKGPAISWFDDIRLSSVGYDFFRTMVELGDPPGVTYKKVSPEKYIVRVKDAERPFVLSLSEAFDPMWVARVEGGAKVDSVPLYATINGFPIDRKGNFTITIEYESHHWYIYGLVISLISLLLCLLYLARWWERKTGSLSGWSRRIRSGARHLSGQISETRGGLRLITVARRIWSVITRHKKLAEYISIAVAFFVLWLLVSLTFAFFACLLFVWIIRELDPKYLVAAALLLLCVCPVMYALNMNDMSGQLAGWAVFFLIDGVLFWLISAIRNPPTD